MRLGILGWDHEELETRELCDAGEELGFDTVLFTVDEIVFRLSPGGVTAHANGVDLSTLDLVVSRAQVQCSTFVNFADRLHLLARAGVRVVESPAPYLTAESKVQTMLRLREVGVAIADTRLCHTLGEVVEVADKLGQVVVKPSCGYGGKDVELVSLETLANLRPGIEGMLQRYGSVLCQEYLPHLEGDLRVNLAGDMHLFSMSRIPNQRSWKANVCTGADWRLLDPPVEGLQLARRAARSVGLFLAGIDLVPVQGGYVVLEVNTCPGWYMLPGDMRKVVAATILNTALVRVQGCNGVQVR